MEEWRVTLYLHLVLSLSIGENMIDRSNKIILVTSATGQQGDATARHLPANSWRVPALSRDFRTPSAQALVQAVRVLNVR